MLDEDVVDLWWSSGSIQHHSWLGFFFMEEEEKRKASVPHREAGNIYIYAEPLWNCRPRYSPRDNIDKF